VASVAQRRRSTIAARQKRGVGRRSKGVQHFETNVVSGVGVLGANITQTNNKIFHLSMAL
jgi:hypothetical protein